MPAVSRTILTSTTPLARALPLTFRIWGRSRSKMMKSSLKMLALLLLAAGAVGYLMGVRLDEERRGRVMKLLSEAREMPFRVFV